MDVSYKSYGVRVLVSVYGSLKNWNTGGNNPKIESVQNCKKIYNDEISYNSHNPGSQKLCLVLVWN